MSARDPYLDDGMRGWIVTTAKKNYWRVASYYELDDLIQDGYLCYSKCYSRYRHLTIKRHPLKEDRRRFMALVQVAFVNHITTLAWKRTRLDATPLSAITQAETGQAVSLEALLPEAPEEASVAALLASAPVEIKRLFQVLVDDALSFSDMLRRKGTGRRRIGRETSNEYFCRLIGLDPQQIDIVAAVNRHFLG